MANAAVRAEPLKRVREVQSEGEERMAPNGRHAVLVDGKWAGYLFDESGGTGGRGSKTIVLFDVEEVGAGLKIAVSKDCDSKNKKKLGKMIHHEHAIKFFDGRTIAGDRCQLFTA